MLSKATFVPAGEPPFVQDQYIRQTHKPEAIKVSNRVMGCEYWWHRWWWHTHCRSGLQIREHILIKDDDARTSCHTGNKLMVSHMREERRWGFIRVCSRCRAYIYDAHMCIIDRVCSWSILVGAACSAVTCFKADTLGPHVWFGDFPHIMG